MITSACVISSNPGSSRGPGSPGPAPTRYTVMARPPPPAGARAPPPTRAGGPARPGRSGSLPGHDRQSTSSHRPAPARLRAPAGHRRPGRGHPAECGRRRFRPRTTSRSAWTHIVASGSAETAQEIGRQAGPGWASSTRAPCPAAGTRAVQHPLGLVGAPQPLQSGQGQDQRVELPLAQLTQPGAATVPCTAASTGSPRTALIRAVRRGLLVPTRAPSGSESSEGWPQMTSRGSARSGIATSSRPGASSAGTSLAECTATSISSANRARSAQRPSVTCPARSDPGRRRWTSFTSSVSA